jgi:hypothetical protein
MCKKMFVGRVGKFALFYLINKNNPMEKDSFAALIAAAQNMRDAQKEYFRAAKKNSSDKKMWHKAKRPNSKQPYRLLPKIIIDITLNSIWAVGAILPNS